MMRYPARCAIVAVLVGCFVFAAVVTFRTGWWLGARPEGHIAKQSVERVAAQRAEKTYGDVECTAETIYDGDTFHVSIPSWPPIIGEHVSVRVKGIDTPEKHDPDPKVRLLATAARVFVVHQVKSGAEVKLRNISRDKYFRIDADVYVGEQSLAQLLLDNYLAKPYDGGTKPVWTAADYQKYLSNKK